MSLPLIFKKEFYGQTLAPLLWLALPLIISGAIEASIGFFSTVFLAQLGQDALAAGALVSWLFATLMVVLWGTLTAVSVLVAQKHGAQDDKAVSLILRDSLILAVLLVIPTFILLWEMAPLLVYVGQNQTTIHLAQSYLHALAWGILPDFIALVILQFFIGLGHARTSTVFLMCWVPIAIGFNYMLIFGKCGLPALGIAGIGWGMTAGYWLTTLALVIYVLIHPNYKRYFFQAMCYSKLQYLNEVLLVGVPMGMMYSIEVGFFLSLTLLMSMFGIQVLAANQIAMQFLGQLMAVVFSIAQAVTVRMGHQIGAKNLTAAIETSYAGVMISLVFMGVASILFWVCPEWIISIDLNPHDPINAEVVNFAKSFMAISALFQLMEAARITLFGSLRAFKDTRFTLMVSIVSFWVLALPLGYALTHTALKASGLWWGMTLGALFSVVVLYWRFQYKARLHLCHEKVVPH